MKTVTLDDPSGEIKLLLSFFPDSANRLASKAALEAEMRRSFGSMLEGAAEREMKIVFTEIAGGLEGHATFTDRQWVGRDVPRDERRLATAGIRTAPGVFIWESETAGWARNNLRPPENVTFGKVGRWDAVFYRMPRAAAGSVHIRAHWIEAGTWIDLHLSLTSDDPKAADQLEAFLRRITVRVK